MSWRDRWEREPEQPPEEVWGEQERARATEAPREHYELDEDAFFAFLEDALNGQRWPESRPRLLVVCALEVANDEWSETEAAQELLLLAGRDRHALEEAHRTLQYGLMRSVGVDVPGIRASRIVREALHQLP